MTAMVILTSRNCCNASCAVSDPHVVTTIINSKSLRLNSGRLRLASITASGDPNIRRSEIASIWFDLLSLPLVYLSVDCLIMVISYTSMLRRGCFMADRYDIYLTQFVSFKQILMFKIRGPQEKLCRIGVTHENVAISPPSEGDVLARVRLSDLIL